MKDICIVSVHWLFKRKASMNIHVKLLYGHMFSLGREFRGEGLGHIVI